MLTSACIPPVGIPGDMIPGFITTHGRMPGAILSLGLDMAIIPGETILDGDVLITDPLTEDLTEGLEMGSTLDIMLAGITPVAVVDSPTITGGGEMTTDMPISLVALRVGRSIDMICLKGGGQA